MGYIMINKKLLISIVSFLILISLVLFGILRDNSKSIDFKTFTTLKSQNRINEAIIVDKYILLKTDNKMYKVNKELININDLWQSVPIKYAKETNNIMWIYIFVFLLLLYYIYRYKNKIYKQTKEISKTTFNQITNSNIKAIKSKTKFADIAGIDSIKEELTEIIDFLNNPNKYRKFDVKLPRGVLLVGPPGVGKTMLASALANEAKVPFFYQNGASFVEIYVGMGAKKVRELFETACKHAPSIIFIDEIDAVGKSRGGNRNDEREATLNQLLTQMDGFDNNSNVIVIAATNKIDDIDEALLRPGRFDRRIFVDLPTKADRLKILDIYLKNKKHNIDTELLSGELSGFSGAAIATLINEAGLKAIKLDTNEITIDIINDIKDKILLGKKYIKPYSKQEKEIQSIYLASQIFCMYQFGLKFGKISLYQKNILPPQMQIESKTSLRNRVKVHLSGLGIHTLLYEEQYSNTKQDIIQAKILVNQIINEYHMRDDFKTINPNDMLQRISKELRTLLNQNIDKIQHIANILQSKEYITYEEIL